MATATVDALTPIVAGVEAYFAHPSRVVVATVEAGEWNTERHGSAAYVVIGPAAFTYYGAADKAPGTVAAPSHWWDLGGGLVAPVVGRRDQTFTVWVHELAPAGTAPAASSLAALGAVFALADVTMAALRDLHGHDLPCTPGKVRASEQGEFTNGATVEWGFTIPIPVLGDPYTYAAAQAMSGALLSIVNGAETAPGVTIEAP